jgi:hypothetical protein
VRVPDLAPDLHDGLHAVIEAQQQDKAFDEGSQMTIDEAVAYALESGK